MNERRTGDSKAFSVTFVRGGRGQKRGRGGFRALRGGRGNVRRFPVRGRGTMSRGKGGRGRGGRGRGRGGRGGNRGALSTEKLDEDLEQYFQQDSNYQQSKLDEELEGYMASRGASDTKGQQEQPNQKQQQLQQAVANGHSDPMMDA